MSWATVDDVFNVAGVTVTAAQLAQAHGTVELHAGRTQDMPAASIRPRDLAWLNRAVIWQVAWQKEQEGYATRSDVSRIAQDGVDVSLAPTGVTLAPLAAQALRNLSWKGTRAVRIAGPNRALAHPDLIDYIDESTDGAHVWEPL